MGFRQGIQGKEVISTDCTHRHRQLRLGGYRTTAMDRYAHGEPGFAGGTSNLQNVARSNSHLNRPLNFAPVRQESVETSDCGLPGHLTGNLFGRSLRNMAPPTVGGASEVSIEKFLSPLVPFYS